MSKKKAGGKTTQHVRPSGKRLGVKVGDNQRVGVGTIILRQRGTKIGAGKGVGVGRDHTLFALQKGTVKFAKKLGKRIVSIVNPKS